MFHTTSVVTFLVTLLGLFLSAPDSLEACTSFAVYSGGVYYAMNFDFIDLPLKFLISTNGDMRTFHLAFERTIGDLKLFVNTAGMNEKGLFAACQELHPVNTHPRERMDADLYTFELYEAIAFCSAVEEIERLARDRLLVDMPGITLHNLFADTQGRAIVTEAGERETVIVDKSGDYLVMTNFPNRSLIDKEYTQARGKGDDRYITCHEYLDRHVSGFDIDNGFELLYMCRNRDPRYPTVCSMVCDPQNRDVYIVLKRDFSKIWKLSIDNNTIVTWRGFEKDLSISIPIGEQGIPASDLVKHAEPLKG